MGEHFSAGFWRTRDCLSSEEWIVGSPSEFPAFSFFQAGAGAGGIPGSNTSGPGESGSRSEGWVGVPGSRSGSGSGGGSLGSGGIEYAS